MASRVNEAVLRRSAGRGTVARPSAATLSTGQRLLFVLALLTFGFASFYTAVALLTRITPALFPGKNFELPIVSRGFELVVPAPLQPSKPSADSAFNQRINLLIMGADARPYDEDATGYQAPDIADTTRTDTLLVATIDPVTKQVSLLSFPRDMLIDIHLPNNVVYQDRINASYGVGVSRGKTFDAGAEQLSNDIEANFGIHIDHWVWLEFKGVEKLVDGLGGIDVDIPDELQVPHWGGQWYYSDDDIHAKYLSFPPGP
jgi:LCP family protein required for cell wall assembly